MSDIMYTSLRAWSSGTDFSKFGKSVVLARDLFLDYILFCESNGFLSNIATQRKMSVFLSDLGYEMKRITDGMAFVLK